MKTYCSVIRRLVPTTLLSLICTAFLPTVSRSEVVVGDAQYKYACGPISCLVALKSIGVESSLERLCRECSWEDGDATKLATLAEVLQSYRGIDCHLAQLTPEELFEILGDDHCAVILAIRKNSEVVNHAVCAVDANDGNQTVTLIDVPELKRQSPIDDIVDVWDGAALVVSVSAAYRAFERFCLLVVPVIAVILAGLSIRESNPRRAIE